MQTRHSLSIMSSQTVRYKGIITNALKLSPEFIETKERCDAHTNVIYHENMAETTLSIIRREKDRYIESYRREFGDAKPWIVEEKQIRSSKLLKFAIGSTNTRCAEDGTDDRFIINKTGVPYIPGLIV